MTAFSPSDLAHETCRPGAPKLPDAAIDAALAGLPGWARHDDALTKNFAFRDYHGTMAFVNAVAWIAHQQDHHPDLDVHYNRCGVTFSTHDAGGITQNDLICAARVESLGQIA